LTNSTNKKPTSDSRHGAYEGTMHAYLRERQKTNMIEGAVLAQSIAEIAQRDERDKRRLVKGALDQFVNST
jgi:hypothetical protein